MINLDTPKDMDCLSSLILEMLGMLLESGMDLFIVDLSLELSIKSSKGETKIDIKERGSLAMVGANCIKKIMGMERSP